MLAARPLGASIKFANLRVYAGPEHPHAAQQPEALDVGGDEPQEHQTTAKRRQAVICPKEFAIFSELKTTLIKKRSSQKTQQPNGRRENRPKGSIARERAYATGKRKKKKKKRGRSGLDQARSWTRHGQRQRERNRLYFRASGAAHESCASLWSRPGRDGQYDVICKVDGRRSFRPKRGAVRHGISKALIAFEPTLRPTLKTGRPFLTRDPRVVERKKYGPSQGPPSQLPILEAVIGGTFRFFLRAARQGKPARCFLLLKRLVEMRGAGVELGLVCRFSTIRFKAPRSNTHSKPRGSKVHSWRLATQGIGREDAIQNLCARAVFDRWPTAFPSNAAFTRVGSPCTSHAIIMAGR